VKSEKQSVFSPLPEEQIKEEILDIGRRMYRKGFVASNAGNISVRAGEDAVWTTPSGVSKGYMTADMLVKTDLAGKILQGDCRPSSELAMHLRIYGENPALGAVVHAHPPISGVFAAAGIPLDKALLQESVVQLGVVPIAPYALPGTEAVARGAAACCTEFNAVLLAHHGAVTWGHNLLQAYYRMEEVEYFAKTMLYARLLGTESNLLTEKQIDDLLEQREKWGIDTGGRPVGRG
jgi:L-fuculose-phosphate aldolase